MAVYPNPRLGPVQLVSPGYGFYITVDDRPIFMFAYQSRDEADGARAVVETAVSTALAVATMPE
jgi:hypothetical protein